MPSPAAASAPVSPAARPAFAHASEAELARILDFYQVRWAYEPDTFPIGWSLAGDVVESFSPDFYLPDFDLYVELTTLKQKLVRKKNRKLRRLRELYPDVRIKLFYARDFRMLLLKFGRLALLDDLSGTTGQATPPRPADRIVADAAEAAEAARLATDAPAREALDPAAAGRPATDPSPASRGLDARDEAAFDGDDGAMAHADAASEALHEGGAARSSSTARGRRRGRRHRGRGGTPIVAGATASAAGEDADAARADGPSDPGPRRPG